MKISQEKATHKSGRKLLLADVALTLLSFCSIFLIILLIGYLAGGTLSGLQPTILGYLCFTLLPTFIVCFAIHRLSNWFMGFFRKSGIEDVPSVTSLEVTE